MNQLSVTHVPGNDEPVQFLRLRLEAPNPLYGVHRGRSYFGVRRIHVDAPALAPIALGDCDSAPAARWPALGPSLLRSSGKVPIA